MQAALTSIRRWSLILITGMAIGAYGVHRYETAPLANYVERGFCGARDIAKTLYLFPCQDAYYAARLQQHDAERDAEVTAILNDMATKTVRVSK